MTSVSLVEGFETYMVSSDGDVYGPRRKLRPKINQYGYPVVVLSDTARGTRRDASVHRLVLEAFAGPCPPGMQADHVNRNRADNRLSNLRWVTREEQNRNRVLRPPKGEEYSAAKLTVDTVRELRTLRSAGAPLRDLARRYSVCEATVSLVARGLRWRHVA